LSFNHEAVAALPVASNADKALIRALCTRRFAYSLDASESAANFIAVDPATGVIPLNLIQNNISFQYDSTDSTTIADGVTCLVTAGGKRYKAASVAPPYSVLTRATVAEPGSPAVGDTYLIPTAATGADWAGKDGQIGTYTARGWVFVTMPIGCSIYVKDENAFYYRAASGTWTAGVGSIAIGAGGVNITNMLGAKASFVVKVENQTTNAPPASPVTPTAYVIGPSPTGAWSGLAGQLAICLAAGTFTIIAPVAGDQVYDKARNTLFQYNGTTWVSAVGAIVGTAYNQFTSSTGLSGSYSASTSVPQTSGGDALMNISYTMKSTTNRLRIRFSGMVSTSAAAVITAAFFLNSNSNAIAASGVSVASASTFSLVVLEHEFVPGTTSPITIGVHGGTNNGSYAFNPIYGAASVAKLILEEITA
jgi:hypothetical protein